MKNPDLSIRQPFSRLFPLLIGWIVTFSLPFFFILSSAFSQWLPSSSLLSQAVSFNRGMAIYPLSTWMPGWIGSTFYYGGFSPYQPAFNTQTAQYYFSLTPSPWLSLNSWGRTYSPLSLSLNFPWAMGLSRSGFQRPFIQSSPPVRAAAEALNTPNRRIVGIESGQLIQRAPAAFNSSLSYIPGLPAYAANQVIVQFAPGTPRSEMNRLCLKHQCKELYTSKYAGFTLVNIPPTIPVIEAVQRLQAEIFVLWAEPNYFRFAHLIPNDPYYKYQWHLVHLNCPNAWDYGAGANVVIALLDSGVAYETTSLYTQAPDLAGTLFAPGYDFVNEDSFPNDDYFHGTHMAGCLAQTTNNLLGAAGVAFNATIMPVKVMDEIGGVTITDEIEGLYFAANNGAKIINMSLGGPGTSTTEAAAITYAYNNGVTIICSAGNNASNIPEYPASYPEPVSVSAIRYDFTFASLYSNYGIYVDVCAPGGDTSIDQNADGFGDGILQQSFDRLNPSVFAYYFVEGTSPAAALVSGVAALIIGKSSLPLSPSEVVTILKQSATDLGTPGWDQYYGNGLINAELALVQTL